MFGLLSYVYEILNELKQKKVIIRSVRMWAWATIQIKIYSKNELTLELFFVYHPNAIELISVPEVLVGKFTACLVFMLSLRPSITSGYLTPSCIHIFSMAHVCPFWFLFVWFQLEFHNHLRFFQYIIDFIKLLTHLKWLQHKFVFHLCQAQQQFINTYHHWL